MRLARTVVILACCAAGAAHAGPKVFVTRAESTANWDTRKVVEELVVGLARNVDRNVSLGDTTLTELASAAGCSGGVEKCKGQILDSLAIDEVVGITIVPAGGDKVKITVRRVSKTAPTREATAIAKAADPAPAMVASIGPLFGAKKIIEPPKGAKQPAPPPSKGTVTPGGSGVVIDNEDPLKKPGPRKSEPPKKAESPKAEPPKAEPPRKAEPAKPEPAKAEPPKKTEPAKADPPKAEPKADPKHETKADPKRENGADPKRENKADSKRTADVTPGAPTETPPNGGEGMPRRSRHKAIAIGGLAVGAAFVLTGIVMWQKANSIESDIRNSPNRTPADIDRLLDLEASGDRYARWGNVFFVVGVAVAGVGGYVLWRTRRSERMHARVTPVVLDRGGGVALVWGTR